MNEKIRLVGMLKACVVQDSLRYVEGDWEILIVVAAWCIILLFIE